MMLSIINRTYISLVSILIDWQLNGRPLPSGTKFKPSYDFGIVKLVIDDVLAKDAGVYKVTATNNKGIASSSGTLKLEAEAASGVSSEGLHPSGQAGLEAIQKLDQSVAGAQLAMKLSDSSEAKIIAPRFTIDLPSEVKINAEQNISLECSFEPKTDTNVDINWYHNGLPLRAGTQIKMSSDFGFVKLNIDGAQGREAGIYTCKASNSAGEATTFTKIYIAESTSCGVDATTKHPRGKAGLESIHAFDGAKGLLPDDTESSEILAAPHFVTDFESGSFEGGTVAHFEAKLEPKTDNMKIEWLHNGKPLKESKIYEKKKIFR